MLGSAFGRRESGTVLLDLGNPNRDNVIRVVPIIIATAAAVGALGWWLVAPWTALVALSFGVLEAVVFLVMGIKTRQQLCVDGIVTSSTCIPWKDLVGYRTHSDGLDLTYRMTGPPGVSEMNTGLLFPLSRRDEVAAVFAAKAPNARNWD